MEDGSQREDVTDGLNMLRLSEFNDLRCDVARSAASEEEILLDISIGCESEIHDDWLERFSSQHDVLWLQIAVHDSTLVDMLQPAQQSSYDFLDLIIAEVPLPLLDELKQRLACQQFQYHINGVIRLKNRLQLQHILMWFFIEFSQYCQFIDQTLLSVLGTVGVLLRECLDRKPHLICQAFRLVNSREVAFAQLFDGFEHLMETFLVDAFLEYVSPNIGLVIFQKNLEFLLRLVVQSNALFSRANVLLNSGISTYIS